MNVTFNKVTEIQVDAVPSQTSEGETWLNATVYTKAGNYEISFFQEHGKGINDIPITLNQGVKGDD